MLRLGIVVRLPFRPFGMNGIAWLFPFIVIWDGYDAQQRLIRHERIHLLQWLEVWLAFFPGALLIVLLTDASPWWLLALYPKYWVVYLVLLVWSKLGRATWGGAYWYHPMEIDARYWQLVTGEIDRPMFFWIDMMEREETTRASRQ